MALAFDIAEAINLLAGGALGEGSASVRERFERAAVRRTLKRAIRNDLVGLRFLEEEEIESVVSYVVSDGFAALITQSPLSAADGDELALILARLSPQQQALVIHRVRQVALAALLRSADLVDDVVVHMLTNIDEASLFLVNVGLDNSGKLDRLSSLVESSLYMRSASPVTSVPPESHDSLEARSLLALTVSAAVRELGVVVRIASETRELIEWTGHALDMLIDDCECQVEQILLVLHRAEYKNFYGSAMRVSVAELVTTNLRLEQLANDARTIAQSLERVQSLPPSVRGMIETTSSIAVAEDFLVLRLHDFAGAAEVDDNLQSPSFYGGLGEATIADLTDALKRLAALRLELRRHVAALIPEL